jgi:hypothetical protein
MVADTDGKVETAQAATRRKYEADVVRAENDVAEARGAEASAMDALARHDGGEDERLRLVAAAFKAIDRCHAAIGRLERLLQPSVLDQRLETSAELARKFR